MPEFKPGDVVVSSHHLHRDASGYDKPGSGGDYEWVCNLLHNGVGVVLSNAHTSRMTLFNDHDTMTEVLVMCEQGIAWFEVGELQRVCTFDATVLPSPT